MPTLSLAASRLSASQRSIRAHDLIHEDIAMRAFANNFLPSEDELAELYGESRTVIRRVLAQLRAEHIIERRQGVGTSIASTQLRWSLNGSEDGPDQYLAAERGLSQVYFASIECIPVPATVARVLDAEPGGDCVCLDYTVFVNGSVTTTGTSYLLDPPASELRTGLFPGGFGEHLRSFGLEFQEFEVLIEAINADSSTAAILDVREGDALLYIRRIGINLLGASTQLTFTRQRSDRSSFTMRNGGTRVPK